MVDCTVITGRKIVLVHSMDRSVLLLFKMMTIGNYIIADSALKSGREKIFLAQVVRGEVVAA